MPVHRTQTDPSMSSSHPYTVVDDEDDTDICPVCDGQCTCRIQPLSMAELSLKYQHSTPAPAPHSPPPPPPTPSLKIKFTLPPSLIAKRRLDTNKSSTNNQQTTSASVTDAYTTPPKKRGRPPKNSYKPKSVAPRKSQKTPAKLNKVRQNLPTFVSASALASTSDSSSFSSSSLSDFESDPDSDIQAEEENFIVADIHDKARLRRELLGGDDPHIKKRSPTHHDSDWVIRPRKKSVGGSDVEQMDVDSDATDDDQPENQNQNDQDEDEDDADEEDEPDGMNVVEEDDEDTDARHHYVGLATGWSEEDESSFDADLFFANLSDSSSSSNSSTTSTRRRCHSYTPADQSSSTFESHPTRTALESLPFEVTENWDGQLIFTNGPVGEAESRGIVDIDFEKDAERFIIDSDADDGDDDDDDSCSSSSNSSSYGPYHHDHLNHDPSSSTAQAPQSSDVAMFSISDADAGYEEEDGGEADEGDTTDEELVGDDSLPNERAMRLFTLPMPIPISMGMGMVSAINPMSTVSPSIGVEKWRRRRSGGGMDVDGDREERKRWRRRLRLDLGAPAPPRAADILAGKIGFRGDEFTGNRDGYASSSSASSDSMVKTGKGKGKQKMSFAPSSSPSSHANHSRQTQIPSTPRTGLFIPTSETREAIIGNGRKGLDVPSPHPRFYGRGRRVSVVCAFRIF